jgi:hypothetical protein
MLRQTTQYLSLAASVTFFALALLALPGQTALADDPPPPPYDTILVDPNRNCGSVNPTYTCTSFNTTDCADATVDTAYSCAGTQAQGVMLVDKRSIANCVTATILGSGTGRCVDEIQCARIKLFATRTPVNGTWTCTNYSCYLFIILGGAKSKMCPGS